MTSASQRRGLSWGSRLLIGLALLLAGAAAAAWALARYDEAARVLGVTPAPPPEETAQAQPLLAEPNRPAAEAAEAPAEQRIAELEARLARVEGAARQVEGSAGRADALLVAFAARRAVDRGVALGYLEPLLVERFGSTHPRAVSTIVSGAQNPVRLSELAAEYEALGPALRSPGADEGWWAGLRRELGSVISIRRADRPSARPAARYDRALNHLSEGEVDSALAETMRLPGADRAGDWVRKARRYVAVQRALDEIESAALLGRTRQNGSFPT